MAGRNSDEHRVLFAGRLGAGSRHPQRGHVAGKLAFGFDLQETVHVAFRQRRQFGAHGQRPLQRQADDAMALAHTGGVEVIADFLSDKFRIGRQRIEGERDAERLLKLQRTVGALEHDTVEPRAIQLEAEQGGRALPPQHLEFFQINHCVFCAITARRTSSPSAHPSPVRSWRYKTLGAPSQTSKMNFTRR